MNETDRDSTPGATLGASAEVPDAGSDLLFAAERAEAQRVQEMVVPFGKRRRCPAAKPRHPTGPGAAP